MQIVLKQFFQGARTERLRSCVMTAWSYTCATKEALSCALRSAKFLADPASRFGALRNHPNFAAPDCCRGASSSRSSQ